VAQQTPSVAREGAISSTSPTRRISLSYGEGISGAGAWSEKVEKRVQLGSIHPGAEFAVGNRNKRPATSRGFAGKWIERSRSFSVQEGSYKGGRLFGEKRTSGEEGRQIGVRDEAAY